MRWILYLIYIYLTYYTFSYARKIWRDGNKAGAIATGLLGASLFPLVVYILMIK